MLVVDAQVHIWGSGTPSGLHRPVPVFTAEELLAEMDAAEVDAAVIHPPVSWDPDSNDLAVDAARRWPERFAVLGQVPLDRPEEGRARLQTWRELPGMMGLRYPLVRAEQQDWHADGTMDWLWPETERLGLPVATMAWRFLPLFRRIAERHPGLRLVVDHLGLVRAAQDSPRCPTWRSRQRARPATPARPTPSATSTTACAASSTPSARTASSGAPTSPGCPVPTASA